MVSVFVVTITMLISVPAAFALARMKFWGSATLATGVFLTYLIPDSLLFIPLFKMFAVFGDWTGIQLINRWYVLVLIYPTLTVPFCTWIMIGYFASIPKELDEAAIIDGASWFQTLTRIFIPVALPGLIAATIFAFTVSWAQFLYPLVFTTSTDQLVLPVGIITTLIKGDVFNWGQIMTGALLGAAPPLDHLCLPDGLLHCRPHRRRDKGLNSMAEVNLRKVIKRYDDVEAVRGIDLDIADHEFVVLVGPSGCGKSTTLRMIAGLEDITDGDIMIGGDVVNDVPPKDRDIAMVFQNYALYPHMTVAENMSFGLRLKRYPKAEIKSADRRSRPHAGYRRIDQSQAEAAVGWPAPARGDGPRHRPQPESLSVRRTAFQSRRQAPGADADRDQEGASESAHHHRLRHPRPGRGDDACRPGRGHEQRPYRANRNTERSLSQTGHALCRRLYRARRDEFPALPA